MIHNLKDSPTFFESISAIEDKDDIEATNEFSVTILDDKFNLTLCTDANVLYGKAYDFAPILGINPQDLVKLLKRLGTSVCDKPFKPRTLFKQRKYHVDYFSIECFKLLVEKNYIKKKFALRRELIHGKTLILREITIIGQIIW